MSDCGSINRHDDAGATIAVRLNPETPSRPKYSVWTIGVRDMHQRVSGRGLASSASPLECVCSKVGPQFRTK